MDKIRFFSISSVDLWVASTYATSPVMSSYQVCIVIGDYVDIFSGNINGYDVGKIQQQNSLKNSLIFYCQLLCIITVNCYVLLTVKL